jgi:hypothetical protein
LLSSSGPRTDAIKTQIKANYSKDKNKNNK